MTKRISLTDVRIGETGKIAEFLGGRGVHNRLRALGIRPGARVTKVSAALMRGPVVLRVGGAQVALGFGISHKVIVEVER